MNAFTKNFNTLILLLTIIINKLEVAIIKMFKKFMKAFNIFKFTRFD